MFCNFFKNKISNKKFNLCIYVWYFSRYEWLQQHNKTLEHCIVTIVYLNSLASLFSSKYCYGIKADN